MIARHTLALKRISGDTPITYSDAYPLYAELLKMADRTSAGALHNSERPPLSQYLLTDCAGRTAHWVVTLHRADEYGSIADALSRVRTLPLASRGACLEVLDRTEIKFGSASELLAMTDFGGCSRFRVNFLSPTSYRSGGEYMIFPSVRHIVQSAIQAWGDLFPDTPADDPDAFEMIEKGTRITGYNLKSTSYSLKGNKIPSFIGSVTLSARLSVPMIRLLYALLSAANMCGSGIKTTLGMGGVEALPHNRKPSEM